jgi:hypothetical protein
LEARIPSNRYSLVLFMHSVAFDRRDLYEQTSNPVRRHTVVESSGLNNHLYNIWRITRVPMEEFDNSTDLDGKLRRVLTSCLLAKGVSPPHGLTLSVPRVLGDGTAEIGTRRALPRQDSSWHFSSLGAPPTYGPSPVQNPPQRNEAEPARFMRVSPMLQSSPSLQQRNDAESARFMRTFPGLHFGAPSAATADAVAAVDTSAPTSAFAGIPNSWSASSNPAAQLSSPPELGSTVTGASSQQWYLGTAISGLVLPRHTRTLSRTPPLAPASAAFTITATGISAAPATSSLVAPIEDLQTFAHCERLWSLYVRQFQPNFFDLHGGSEKYTFYLQEIETLAKQFGVSAAMEYDEGVRRSVLTGRDTMSNAVTDFDHFDIKLHQQCFFTSRMAALQADQPSDVSKPATKPVKPAKDKAGKTGNQNDLSTNVRKCGDGRQVCFNFNLGRCTRAPDKCHFAHVCTRCGLDHGERPNGLQGSRCRKPAPTGATSATADTTTASTTASAAAAP